MSLVSDLQRRLTGMVLRMCLNDIYIARNLCGESVLVTLNILQIVFRAPTRRKGVALA